MTPSPDPRFKNEEQAGAAASRSVTDRTATARVDVGTVREIAVAASVDPRSVLRVLRGERVRGLADTRIRRELNARNIRPPTTSQAA